MKTENPCRQCGGALILGSRYNKNTERTDRPVLGRLDPNEAADAETLRSLSLAGFTLQPLRCPEHQRTEAKEDAVKHAEQRVISAVQYVPIEKAFAVLDAVREALVREQKEQEIAQRAREPVKPYVDGRTKLGRERRKKS